MKLISWNVNGIRAAVKKGLIQFIQKEQADIYCFQETKVHDQQLPFDITNIDDYQANFVNAQKKGYSGVANYSRLKPNEITKGFGNEKFDQEGRTLIYKFNDFSLYNVYFPNGKASQERLDYKMAFYQALLEHLQLKLKAQEKIIICGDVNTAHREIDLARPKENTQISGFLSIERAWIDQLLQAGFIDTFRHCHPKQVKYSWWSMRTKARERNVGWRIDYFFVSQNLQGKIQNAAILDQIPGSDHAPISLEINL